MSRIVSLGGFRITDATRESLARLIRRRLNARIPTTIFFANANFIVQCAPLSRRIDARNVHVVNDGVAIALAARIKHGIWFRDNLNGTDFTPFLIERMPLKTRIALAGSTTDVVSKAAGIFQALPHVEVVDIRNGFEEIRSPDAIRSINGARADVLLVGMGNPIQEKWILENRDQLEVPVVMGVGALFDFMAGKVTRAPRAIRQLRLEWLFRLCQEPRRLFRRYTVDTARFFIAALSPGDL